MDRLANPPLTTPEDLGPTCHRDRVSRGGSSPIATDRDRIRAHRALKRNFNPVSPAGGPRLAGPASQLLVQGRGSGSRRPPCGPVVPVRAPPTTATTRAHQTHLFFPWRAPNAPADARALLDRFGGRAWAPLPESFGTNASKARVVT